MYKHILSLYLSLPPTPCLLIHSFQKEPIPFDFGDVFKFVRVTGRRLLDSANSRLFQGPVAVRSFRSQCTIWNCFKREKRPRVCLLFFKSADRPITHSFLRKGRGGKVPILGRLISMLHYTGLPGTEPLSTCRPQTSASRNRWCRRLRQALYDGGIF